MMQQSYQSYLAKPGFAALNSAQFPVSQMKCKELKQCIGLAKVITPHSYSAAKVKRQCRPSRLWEIGYDPIGAHPPPSLSTQGAAKSSSCRED
jgi:hypothetical protein